MRSSTCTRRRGRARSPSRIVRRGAGRGAHSVPRRGASARGAYGATIGAVRGLRPDEKAALRDFWHFYEPHADRIHEELLLACRDTPGWAGVAGTKPPDPMAEQHARTLALLRAAILRDDWPPYLDELRRQGTQYAKEGTTFSAWCALLARFRRCVRSRLDPLVREDPAHAIRIGDALARFNDLVLEQVGEAYLAAKEAVVHDQQAALRALSQQTLRATDEMYRRFVEGTHEGVVATDAEGRYTFVNRRLEEMLGYEPGELLGRHYGVILSEENLPLGARNFEHRRVGVPGRGELKVVRKDGSDLWVMFASSPLTDDDGVFCGAFGLLVDITERRRADEALRDQTAVYEALLGAQSGNRGRGGPHRRRPLRVCEQGARPDAQVHHRRAAHAAVVLRHRRPGPSIRPPRTSDGPAATAARSAGEARPSWSAGTDGASPSSTPRSHSASAGGGSRPSPSFGTSPSRGRCRRAWSSPIGWRPSAHSRPEWRTRSTFTPLAYVTANLDMIAEEIRALGDACPPGRARELDSMVTDARQGAERVRKIVRELARSRFDDEKSGGRRSTSGPCSRCPSRWRSTRSGIAHSW